MSESIAQRGKEACQLFGALVVLAEKEHRVHLHIHFNQEERGGHVERTRSGTDSTRILPREEKHPSTRQRRRLQPNHHQKSSYQHPPQLSKLLLVRDLDPFSGPIKNASSLLSRPTNGFHANNATRLAAFLRSFKRRDTREARQQCVCTSIVINERRALRRSFCLWNLIQVRMLRQIGAKPTPSLVELAKKSRSL